MDVISWEELILPEWSIERRRFNLDAEEHTIIKISDNDARKILKAMAIPMWQIGNFQYKLIYPN